MEQYPARAGALPSSELLLRVEQNEGELSLALSYLGAQSSVAKGRISGPQVTVAGDNSPKFPRIPLSILEALQAAAEGKSKQHLRLQLIGERPAALAWEEALMRMTLPTRLTVSRYGGVPAALPKATGELRGLVAWANPATASHAALLHARREAAAVLHEWEKGRLRIIGAELAYATPEGLARAVREVQPHVLHLIAHCERVATGFAAILHGPGPGSSSPLYVEDLLQMLRSTPVRLTYFSGCRTAGPEGTFSSTMGAVVPCRIGFQGELPDEAGCRLAEAFHRGLCQEEPVEEALLAARLEAAPSLWPVLHLDAPSGSLFEPLSRDPSVPSEAPLSVPYRSNPHFVPRPELFQSLREQLALENGPPIVLTGLGGVGKTQAALEFALAERRSYSGGIFWIDARDAERLQGDLAALGRFFDVPESMSIVQRAQCVIDALQELTAPSLLVFDGWGEATPVQLPSEGRCRILITTRNRHGFPQSWKLLQLSTLDEAGALAILERARPLEDAAERKAALAISERLGNLPLGLSLVAHHVERLQSSYAAYFQSFQTKSPLEWLERARRRFVASTGHSGGVFEAIASNFERLSSDGKAVLCHLSCCASQGISPEIIHRACDGIDVPEALADLEDYNLVGRRRDGALSVHELVRAFAQYQLPEAERAAVIARVARVLTGRLEQANRSLNWPWIRGDLAHCCSVLQLCRELRLSAEAVPLLVSFGEYHFHQRDLIEADRLLEECRLSATEAGLGESHAIATALQFQAVIRVHHDCGEEAIDLIRSAIAIASRDASLSSEALAECYNAFGYILKFCGRTDESLAWYRRSLEAYTLAYGTTHPEIASCHNNLGAALEQVARNDEALNEYRTALELDETAFGSDHPKAAIRLNNIGRVLSKEGKGADAGQLHERALRINETVYGRRHIHVGWTLKYLGDAHSANGDPHLALGFYGEALPILEAHYGTHHQVCCQLAEYWTRAG